MSTFSSRLKTLRKIHAKSQKDLAKIIGISENSYQRYEYATREPDIATIKMLADYFNVSIDFLIGHGVFSNWEDIAPYQEEIITAFTNINPSFKDSFPKDLSPIEFIRILPYLFAKIDIEKDTNTIKTYPLFKETKN